MKPVVASVLAAAALLPTCQAVARAVDKTPPQTQADVPPSTVGESLAGQRYVAIGSSYAAGPMLPPAKSGAPVRCGQSLSNYPTLLAKHLGMVLIDRSCSGATTEHVLGPWGEIPPQIDSVTPDTRLVTLTIGGNDLSYVGNLFSASCLFNAHALATAETRPSQCGAVRIPTEADYVRDEAQLNAIARRIRTVAPLARLVFVQYLTPLPPAGALCPVTPISEEHAAIVREIGRRLSLITARVAQAHGATIVEMDRASLTHTPCDPEPWMIGFPAGYDGKQGLQWHLNKAGMKATADSITSALIQSGPKPDVTNLPVELTTAKAPVPSAELPVPAVQAPVPGIITSN